ncbi:MAG: hypothetical protein JWO40_299 [Candidatus Doudnabacteria bacterium]|nr:hypothetical protein [Candidatus Doudnabacteria bacterium]
MQSNKNRINLKHLAVVAVITSMLFNNAYAIADTVPTATSVADPAIPVPDPNAGPSKAELQKQLDDIENQIAGYEQQLQGTLAQKNTLANKVKSLKTEQQKLTLQIQSTNLLVGDLANQIKTTEDSIIAAQLKSDQLKDDIAGTIFTLYQNDEKSLASALAGDNGLSGYFQEIDSTQKISQGLSVSLDQMKKLKTDLEANSTKLEGQKQDAQDLLGIKALQSQDLVSKVTEQSSLLSDTKGQESQYNAIINDSKKKAAQIRNQLYDLTGVTKQVTFGEALDIASTVSKETGVRAALLLAILTQETNLGKNVGTCNRAGDPPEKSWKVVMKPNRDQEPFVTITNDLGLDTDTTPVSCPMHDSKGNQVGWGGAMGPAQFIPSTWMSHKDDVAAVTGHPANPWDINDAFVASALLLKVNGAASGGTDAEWKAAMRYFSGGTNVKYRFYGDNVLALANKYQANIDALNQ